MSLANNVVLTAGGFGFAERGARVCFIDAGQRVVTTPGFAAFESVATELGLEIHPKESSLIAARITLDGSVDGLVVHVEQARGEVIFLEVRVVLDPRPDLRLSIRNAGLTAKVGSWFGKHDIEVGDAAFDAACEVRGAEPQRVRALLTPAVRAGLVSLVQTGARFHLTDESLFFWRNTGAYQTASREELLQNIRGATELARAVVAALDGVPSSVVLAPYVDAWREYAGAHGLHFSASPLRVFGNLGSASIRAHATATDDDAYGVELRLAFATPLPWYVRVRPTGFFDFLEGTGEAAHANTGDPSFDRELRFTTTHPLEARAILDADLRKALLALHHEQGAVILETSGLSVRTDRMASPDELDRILDRVAIVARHLESNSAPYRG